MIENQRNLLKQFKIQFMPNLSRWRPMCGVTSQPDSGKSCGPWSPETMGSLSLSSPLKKTATLAPSGEILPPSRRLGSPSIRKLTRLVG